MKNPPQIFLCYARQDEEDVSVLYEKLSSAGFHPFMAPKDILPGENWKQVIINTIREAPFFLACLSNHSVDKRGVIQEEIREALDVWRQKLDADIYLIPVRLEDCSVPGALAKFQWVNLFQTDGFERLMMAINIGMERLGIILPRSQPPDNPRKIFQIPLLVLLGSAFIASLWFCATNVTYLKYFEYFAVSDTQIGEEYRNQAILWVLIFGFLVLLSFVLFIRILRQRKRVRAVS